MRAATATASLLAPLRGRLKAWALRRQGRDALPLRLTARRVYILPTTAGWTFALLLGVMFIAGMNYGNGLALLFTFWLAGFALVAMVMTQRVLTTTRITAATATPAHAGENLLLRVEVQGRQPAADLQLSTGNGEPAAQAVDCACGDPGAGELRLSLPALRRGRWRAPPLRLSTHAPFGLFETWTWLTPEITTLVYPSPAGTRRPPDRAATESGGERPQPGLDELAWLRDFREGDSPRQVAWKAYARGQPLLVREYHGAGGRHHDFDYDALDGLDVEARLSQLTRWVLEAHAAGAGWTLRLPGLAPLPGHGREHLLQCLSRLALHGGGSKAP